MVERISAEALLEWRRRQLNNGGQASALDWLLDLKAGLGWQQLQQLLLRPNAELELAVGLEQLEQLWQRHLRSDAPLQYLVGRCPWRDLELSVQPGVLIPRQETELLVELALSLWPGEPTRQGPAPTVWADLGTGSGCLAIALARALPASRGYAVDQSTEALRQAQTNLEAYGLSSAVELRQGSWWEPLRDQWGRLDLVLSNPPYIPTAVWQELEPGVREHEPELALNGGPDGLAAIRLLCSGALTALAPGGWLLLEHHHDQSAAVLSLLQQSGMEAVTAHRDLEGVERFAIARAPIPRTHAPQAPDWRAPEQR